MMSTNTMSGEWSAIFGECVEAVDCRKDLAALLGEQGLCGPADRLAVVDDQHFETLQNLIVVRHTLITP